MKKILIIGNGFDLYHGLPTGYKDFLFFAKNWKRFKDEYDKQDKSDNSNKEEVINVRLGERNTLTEESLLDFAKHAYLYSEEHIAYLDEHLQDNVWLTYFERVAISGDNWIDFEAEIERALGQVEIYYHRLLPSSIDKMPTKLMPKLMSDVIFLFSDKAEKAGTGYENLAKSIFRSLEADPEHLRPNKNRLLEMMKIELDALNKCLNYYLLEFISVINCGVFSEQIK